MILNNHNWQYIVYGDTAINWDKIDMTEYQNRLDKDITDLPIIDNKQPKVYLLKTLTRDEISLCSIRANDLTDNYEKSDMLAHWICKFSIVELNGEKVNTEKRHNRNVCNEDILRDLLFFEKILIAQEIQNHSIISEEKKRQ